MSIYLDSIGGASVHDWSPIRDSDHDFYHSVIVPIPVWVGGDYGTLITLGSLREWQGPGESWWD